MGASPGPRNLVERAAAAGMDAIEELLGAEGASVATLYIALHARDVGEEIDSVAAGTGPDLPEDLGERARDIVAFLVSEAVAVGRQIGVDVKIVPLRGGPLS